MEEPSVRFLFLVSIAVGIEHNLEIQNVDNLVQICSIQSGFEVTFMIPVSFSFSKAGYSMPVTKALLTATTIMMMAKTFWEQVLTKWQLCWWWSWLQSGDNDWDCIVTTTPWLQRPSWWLWWWCEWWWWWWPWQWWFAKWWRDLACTQGRMTHSRAQLWSVALPCRSM